MTSPAPARRRTYRTTIRRGRVAGLLTALALGVVVLGLQLPASSSSGRTPNLEVPPGDRPDGAPRRAQDLPGLANLDRDLAAAVREAAAEARGDGVELVVTSGWRSAEHQERLLREAIATYGSAEEAARWVAAPHLSAHVAGKAVDIGPDAARAWLSEHGSAYGLCQIYRNEPWHFELRARADTLGCPAMYADPTHDPQLQQ